MLRTGIFLAALSCAAAAYAEPSDINDKLLSVKGTLDSINEELSSAHADVSSIKNTINASAKAHERMNRQMLDEIKALRRQNQSLIDMNQALINAAAGGTNSSKSSEVIMNASRNYDVETPDGKMLFGGEEYVYVKEAEATFAARVDTGATVSSITATNISRYESDGVKMVRFTIEANDRKIEAEAPFIRVTRVRQSSADGFSYRVVVGLNIKIGNYSVYSEFNLMDRTSMDFPMLLGRTLLTDIAAVDVSRNYIQKRADPDGLVLINSDLYNLLKRNGKDPNSEYDERMAKSAAGQIALPDDDHATLGTNSKTSLPEVSQQMLKEEYTRRMTDAGVSLPADLKKEQDEKKQAQALKEGTASNTGESSHDNESTLKGSDKEGK